MPMRLLLSLRFLPLVGSALLAVIFLILAIESGAVGAWVAFAPFLALTVLGIADLVQTRHAVLRNYPISAHLRFIFESIRPEMRQYFFEDEKHGMPFGRDKRAIVYQRAKRALDKRPFGTGYDVYENGYEWLNHSMAPAPLRPQHYRVRIGGPDCAQPYDCSIFNISAMSFGALSANAIRALNRGALKGGFAHDTGEGGFSAHHREGGDVIWELGSGYFGARAADGSFSPERFQATAMNPQIRMIEIKLSQGAKPGHGGVLPGAKVTAEIAEARGVAIGEDCISPSRHSAFSTPIEMMRFIAQLRALSGGKPIGFKLCVGHEWEFLAICKAMLETKITPDFIVVDGKEGGTGAAPLEFLDHVGKPLREGLTFVHNALVGVSLREKIKLGASGKIATAFDILRVMALGADWCNAGRGFMFALGCIQSQSCHTDNCPTGVATQDQWRQRALVVTDKAQRVANYHHSTLEALAELVAAAGLDSPSDITPDHISRRISSTEAASFAQLYPALAPGCLLRAEGAERYRAAWERADARSFAPRQPVA